ncbi:MAG: hypothetical protein ABI972_05405 [Acidobacteriota bacterium]
MPATSTGEGGLPIKKRITVTMLDGSGSPLYSNYTEVQYTYDSEGRRTQMVYPKGRSFDGSSWTQDASRTLDYTYDSMGRANTMSEPGGTTWMSSVTDNAASQPTNLSGETRTYNILVQLTQLTNGSNFSERYDYSATQNNGRITGKKNLRSGEEVQYTYDSLQHLSSAITVTDPLVTQWGQNFTYDGWGNLLGATVAKGSADVQRDGEWDDEPRQRLELRLEWQCRQRQPIRRRKPHGELQQRRPTLLLRLRRRQQACDEEYRARRGRQREPHRYGNADVVRRRWRAVGLFFFRINAMRAAGPAEPGYLNPGEPGALPITTEQ